jgi:HD superfamily phosphohydrolase
MTFQGRNTVIMDSMHGLTDVDPKLWRVLDTPELQRLRWIRQTGLAFLVYPGSEHSRFAHVLGAYGIARRVFKHLRARSTSIGTFSPSQLGDELEQAFVTAALCHDLGHTAFSHVLEQLLLPEGLRTHEDCTLSLLENGTVGNQIKNVGCDLEQVLQLLKGVHWNDGLYKLLSGHVNVDR